MKDEADRIWEFMGGGGFSKEVIFTGNRDQVQREAMKNHLKRRIHTNMKYRTFLKTAEMQKPEWKAIDDVFYTDAGISKKEFERRDIIGATIFSIGLIIIVGGVTVLAAKFFLPNIIPHAGSLAFPSIANVSYAAVGRRLGGLFGLVWGVSFVWKKFGPIAGILSLIVGIAVIMRGLL